MNHPHHLAEPAAADDADVDVVGANVDIVARCAAETIESLPPTRPCADLRGLLVVVQEGVAVARRGFGRLEGHAGPRRRARGVAFERALAFAVGVGVAPRRALEKVAWLSAAWLCDP